MAGSESESVYPCGFCVYDFIDCTRDRLIENVVNRRIVKSRLRK